MGLRDDLTAALGAATKPQPFELATLGGLRVWIHQMTPRQVREWWVFEYADGRPVTYDKLTTELFTRCCVDENDVRLFTPAEAAELLDKPGAGKAVEEFYLEARRQNWLFQTDAKAAEERRRFFDERAAATKGPKPATLSSSSSNGSPSTPATPTPTA